MADNAELAGSASRVSRLVDTPRHIVMISQMLGRSQSTMTSESVTIPLHFDAN